MSIQDVLAQAPAKVQGTTRVVVCQEVFDYKAGAAFVAVAHPISKISFMVEAPRQLNSADAQAKHAAEIALKKSDLEKVSRPAQAAETRQKGGIAYRNLNADNTRSS